MGGGIFQGDVVGLQIHLRLGDITGIGIGLGLDDPAAGLKCNVRTIDSISGVKLPRFNLWLCYFLPVILNKLLNFTMLNFLTYKMRLITKGLISQGS